MGKISGNSPSNPPPKKNSKLSQFSSLKDLKKSAGVNTIPPPGWTLKNHNPILEITRKKE
ncbi:hypothetical protein A2769_03810 [Candidatus Daviesbacteria bacterium RIFCSPHIGHO2_01_FULL_37_27]|nr:MAG: hypothetical protein A2769_03810 [Candidatus Daviesbacteria bacterium RIFCSPHIGHO2_01_FULL_37_27]